MFHSPTMQMEDQELHGCIDDIIAILKDPKELKARQDAKRAVSKLKELKQQNFIITTHNEAEVCRDALAAITNKSEELKQMIQEAKQDIDNKQADASKSIDDKAHTAALKALTNHNDIQSLKQTVEWLNGRIRNLELDNSMFRQEISVIKERLNEIDNNIDTLQTAREQQIKRLKYVEEKQALQKGLVEFYRRHYIKTSISPLKIQQNNICIQEVYMKPKMAIAEETKPNGRKQDEHFTRTKESKSIHRYHEIFKTHGRRHKAIYVLGDVGTGKSSFCKMMIQNWCKAVTDTSINSVTYNEYYHSSESDAYGRYENTDTSDDSDRHEDTDGSDRCGGTDDSDSSDESRKSVGRDSDLSSASNAGSLSDTESYHSDNQSSGAVDENINEMRNFDFLFFIPLQKMSGVNELTEMIKAIAGTSDFMSIDLIETIFEQESERCLILADGLNEWTPPQNENPLPHVSYGLPNRYKIRNATCVTLSRPLAKGVLNMKSSEYDQKVQLLGIHMASVKCFIAKYLSAFNADDRSVTTFMKKIKTDELSHLENTPLLLQQLMWLYCTGHEIGKSISDTYSHLVNVMLGWSQNKEEGKEMEQDQIRVPKQDKHVQQLPSLLQRFPRCESNKRLLLL
ncbi:uncharacterized protein LOC123550048 [Mercenaria mercenaria]|uniref:uncharacterized protein LOC123550048 n=1 Tax=Mercenaria mercenaria TaxID=6596 RepID=UPI00234EE4EE|nr:uncharacterized protein LOC123550048 [Mercenaria mercenaria]